MDHKKVFWGVLFIFIGLVFVLKNLSILDFSWYQFINLWPLLLIIWGVSMLPVKGFVKLILSFAILVLGVYLVHRYDSGYWFEFRSPRHHYDRNLRDSRPDRQNDSGQTDEDWKTQYLFFPYSDEVQNATLKLDAAAGAFTLGSITDELIEVEKEGNFGSYSLTSQEARDSYIVRLSMEETHIRGERLKHHVDIKLHERPVWNMDMDIGAAKIDLNLTPFKTKNIKIDGGASSIRMKLGDRHSDIHVDIDAGASSIFIEVPESSGCRVKTSSVLSGKNMRDFKKGDNGRYETENFNESENKVFIDVDVAVSKIEIKRY